MIATTTPEETKDQELMVNPTVATIGNTTELKSRHLMAKVLTDLLPNHQTVLRALALLVLNNLKILLVVKIVDPPDEVNREVDPLVQTKRNQCASSRIIPTRPRKLLSESLSCKLGAKLQFDRRAKVDSSLLQEEVAVVAFAKMMKTPCPTKTTFLEQFVRMKFLKLIGRSCLMMTSS